jgi:hypothetical protein
LLTKYIKCNVWRLAVRYDIYIYIYVIRHQRVNVEQKRPFYGTLSLFMKVYEVTYDVSSIIPKLK